MTLDVLDPGPDWTWPHVPRDPDGYLDEDRLPVGPRLTRIGRRQVLVNVTPTVRDRHGYVIPLTDVVPRRPRDPDPDPEAGP